MKSSTVTNGQKTQRTYEGLSREDLLKAYRWIVLSRRLDDKEIQLKNQSQIFFQISGAGHEAILVAAGMALKAGHDWFFPYYRDRALALVLGLTPYEMLLAAVGSKDDPASGGRMMPSHWSKPSLHIVNGSSATGTQCLQAAGCAEASKKLPLLGAPPPPVAEDEITYVSLGDGATGEGEFWEFLNTICAERLPVVCLCDLVSRRLSHGGRRHFSPRRIVPEPRGDSRRRNRSRAKLPRHEGGGRLRSSPQRPCARPRQSDSAVLALAVRRRAGLQDG
jgi:TPP-dependent pyruvate/acetoin dehydrogenase alpha subunit